MIGVGAMIGAGISVLTGIAAGESGPASILAFALNGFVTLLMDIDVERKLIEASSVAGGIAKESRDYDLVVLGAIARLRATRFPIFESACFKNVYRFRTRCSALTSCGRI